MMKPAPKRQLKVAFVVGAFPKLSETFILDQITGLLDRGCDIDIYADVPEDANRLHPDAVSYNVLERTSFAFRDMPRNFFHRALKAGVAMTSLKRQQVGPLLRTLNFFRYGRDAAELRLFFRALSIDPKRSYDIVHCHFGPNGLNALQMQRLGLLPGRLVVSFHGYDLSTWLLQAGSGSYAELFAEGSLFLPISRFWKDKLIELGCRPEKIRVQRMGVDPDAFTFVSQEYNKGDDVNLISICRLTEKKGINYAISAVVEAARSHPFSYTIVGDGPLRTELEKQIVELGATSFIRIVGWKLRDEIVAMLGEAHALLAPSVTAADGDMEGIPVTIMEAMARGLPVVSTYHSGIPELVIDHENGLLAPERDIGKLAKCLLDLAGDPGSWVEMGTRGREQVKKHFNASRINDELISIYHDVIQ